jgi:uncharacterized protein DUF3303
MRFLVSWTLPHGESYRAAAARFLEGGGTPPAGVELIGRWHGGNGKGFAIADRRREGPIRVVCRVERIHGH